MAFFAITFKQSHLYFVKAQKMLWSIETHHLATDDFFDTTAYLSYRDLSNQSLCPYCYPGSGEITKTTTTVIGNINQSLYIL